MSNITLDKEKDFKLSFEYKMHIQSEPWKNIRQMCLIRSGFMCEKCGKVGKQMGGDTTLHVHHKTYRNFGQEDLEDLEVLCKVCHQNQHRRIKW